MQADPTEQAMPSRSSESATDDAVRVAGDHRQEAGQALLRVPGQLDPATARTAFASRSRRRRSRATVAGRSAHASS